MDLPARLYLHFDEWKEYVLFSFLVVELCLWNPLYYQHKPRKESVNNRRDNRRSQVSNEIKNFKQVYIVTY